MYRGAEEMIQLKAVRSMGCVARYRAVLKIPKSGVFAPTPASPLLLLLLSKTPPRLLCQQLMSLHSSTEKLVTLKVQQTILHCIECQGRTGVCWPTQSMAACTRIAPLACMYYYISTHLDTSHQYRRQQHVSAVSANADRLIRVAGNHQELYSWTG